jgi:hypothetical protein
MGRLPVIAGAITLFGIVGCIPMAADGAFRVHGEIVGASVCELQLFDTQARELLQRVKVSGAFRETFVVAPGPRAYRLDLSCNGGTKRSVLVEYGGAVTYDKPIDLGKVAL